MLSADVDAGAGGQVERELAATHRLAPQLAVLQAAAKRGTGQWVFEESLPAGGGIIVQPCALRQRNGPHCRRR